MTNDEKSRSHGAQSPCSPRRIGGWRDGRCPVPLFWDDTAVVPPGEAMQAIRLPTMGPASRGSAVETGFGEVDVVLDAAQDFVVNGVFVAQRDDGVAFGFEGFPGQLFEVS